MPRVLKKTRIKGIPAKVQLQRKDALTGSYPSQVRISSDNRTGNFNTFFDDTTPLVFTRANLAMPSGLPVGHHDLTRLDATGSQVRNENMVTTLTVSGALRKGVGDTWVTFAPPGQALTPFRDHGHPAVEALSFASQDPFYATGSNISDIGDGFTQPLWDKTLVEIDMTPSVAHSMSAYNAASGSVGLHYPMMYWNPNSRKFEGIGTGKVPMSYTSSSALTDNQKKFFLQQHLEDQCLGFMVGLSDHNVDSNYRTAQGQPVSNWGFPYHPKFHASSSNLIPLSGILGGPFLLEKIVLEFSGAMSLGSGYSSTGSNLSLSVTNFFLLNQRAPFAINNQSQQSILFNPSTTQSFMTGAMVPGLGTLANYTTRDLITTLRIGSYVTSTASIGTAQLQLPVSMACNITLYNSGANITNQSIERWGGRFVVSGTVSSPVANQGMNTFYMNGGTNGTSMLLQLKNSNRSGLFGNSGRSWISDFSSGDTLLSATRDGWTFNVLRKYAKSNPYILLPTDKLILGWQVPLSRVSDLTLSGTNEYSGTGPSLIFPASPAKLTLYGSLIREGREYHDTLNQLLTSAAVHEAIE